MDSTLRLDIRYARADNFVGRAVYSEPRAFLQKVAAEALVRVHRKLAKDGLGLLIFDGYRPWSVTKVFWDLTPVENRRFVANPETGSRHNRGCAVDLSMFDLSTGRPVDMPTDFDEFTERAAAHYSGATESQRRNRDHLIQSMSAEGFTVYSYEWWHFDHPDWKSYPVLDLRFDEIS
ncbi:D-alanyl-D-alanine dipeptidase [bacterium]|nr:D-alanyl-D-alanine dipeptidase [bacterium]